MEHSDTPESSLISDIGSDDIAIIGIACRFPGGASDTQKFWELLHDKRSAFTKAPTSRYNVDAFHDPSRNKLSTLSAIGGHFLEQDVAAFDAPFFNITTEEAKAVDPTARMLLEVTYEALENAGLPIENLTGGDTSCYVGCFTRDYHEMLMRDAETSPMYAGTGTGFSLLSNRVSWFYDFRGPSMTLDTACSSSLVGMHLACQSLRSKESKIAVVSGANLILSPDLGMWLSNLRMTSVDGLSKSFADNVTGYGRGEGIATVILKPLADALKDGDAIRAIVRGTGVNQDGHTTGITLPNSEAQAHLIRTTYSNAGLDFFQTSYFEAHGTGTQAGDPLELGAVARTISQIRNSDDKLFVGSVKSNIGHLEGAAGLAGVIKCILMLEKDAILPNIHFDQPSKRIPFDAWNIQIPTDVIPWPQNRLKRVSVNSFGYGGTNAHAIIDDAEQFLALRSTGQDWQIVEKCDVSDELRRMFVFSASDEPALRRMIKQIADYTTSKSSHAELRTSHDRNVFLDRLSFTLSNRRSRFSWKTSIAATTLEELQENLSAEGAVQMKRTPDKPRIAFVFTGQGAQWARMGIGLMAYEVFRDSVHAADNHFTTHLQSDWSVITELQRDKSESSIHQARFSQPLCTVLQIALVELLKSWNIEPTGVVGHSSGEIAAAYCYGALSREDAWTIAYWRGKVCSEMRQEVPHLRGAMMAVGLSSEEAEKYIGKVKAGKSVVACINSPSSVTISGDEVAIDELKELLSADAVFCRKLVVENAYHSHHMELIVEKYLQKISAVSTLPKHPSVGSNVKMASSVTGSLINGPEELGPVYWVQNFVSPVQFSQAVATLLKEPSVNRRRRARTGDTAFDLILEVGPHSALQGPLRQILQYREISTVTYIPLLTRGQSSNVSALNAASELYIQGASVQIMVVNKQTTKASSLKPLVDLPTYPWNHSLHYWSESRLSRNYRFRKHPRHDLLGAPVADFNENEPRWRNILRVTEQPWLKDHVVYSSILYPGSGMIVMVLEAVQQLASSRTDQEIESIKLDNVRIGKAIVIPEDQAGIETILQLRRQADKPVDISFAETWEFTVLSCRNDSKLEENSSGMVTVRYNDCNRSLSADTTVTSGRNLIKQLSRKEWQTTKAVCTQKVNPANFYQATQAAGLKYGPAFQGLTDIKMGPDRCVCILKIPDWQKSRDIQWSSHLIHPTTLDIIFHSMFAAIVEQNFETEGKLDFKTAAVPIAFDSLTFYMDKLSPSGPSHSQTGLSTCCNVTKAADQRDLVADIYVSGVACQEPKIVVQGIRCRELPKAEANVSKTSAKAPLGTLVWKPDLDFTGPFSLEKYINKLLSSNLSAGDSANNSEGHTWEQIVAEIVRLAAFKDPELSILQLGISNTLTKSILEVLSTQDDPNVSFAKYTVIEEDAQAINKCQSTFSIFNGLKNFDSKTLDSVKENGGIKDNTFDIIVAVNELVLRDEMQPAIDFLRPGGRFIYQMANRTMYPWEEHVRIVGDVSHTYGLNQHQENECNITHKTERSHFQPGESFVIIQPQELTAEIVEISHQLSNSIAYPRDVHAEIMQWSTEITSTLHGKSLVFLLEIDKPFLSNISEDDYKALKSIILSSARLLWVSRGPNPDMQAPIGFLRVLQNENVNLDLRYLLLEQRPHLPANSVAVEIKKLIFHPTKDREYMQIDDCLCINRWLVDERLDQATVSHEIDQAPPLKLMTLQGAGDSVLELRYARDKQENRVWFSAVEKDHRDGLLDNEVEVQVKAFGLRCHPQISNAKSIKEFSGMITRGGKHATDFRLGDRVWACAMTDSYMTSLKINQALCRPIPANVSFEDAACWAITYGTAHHVLIEMAKVDAGKTVLIESAATAIGQMAIQFSRLKEARVYVTVDSEEQFQTVQELGVARENILQKNDPGLDLVLSQLSSDKGFDFIISQDSTGSMVKQLWNSIAANGTLIDIEVDTAADKASSSLAIAPFRRGASYKVFSLSDSLENNPSKTLQIMDQFLNFEPHLQNLRKPAPWAVFSGGTANEAFEWISSHQDEGKAVLTFGKTEKIEVDYRSLNSLDLDPFATYLLAGGLGGLGKSLARLLAKLGARNLAFVSRSGSASKHAESLTLELAAMGVKTGIYAADVSDRTAMTAMLSQCAVDMPPIRGVIQSAAVLEDSIYDNMTYKLWIDATRPKIQGSWHLHDLLATARQDLDFFVMLSSIAGVVGNRSQANYSAGNTYQDALASYRRSLGLPAVSVDLGLMLGIGLIAEERGGATNLQKWEAVGINEEEFHALITAAMAENKSLPTQVICGLPTGGILQTENLDRPFYFDDPRFSFLRQKGVNRTLSTENEGDTAETPSLQLSRAQSTREAIDIITGALRQKIGRGLQIAADDVDINRPLHSYGIDSLMAVEIRTWIAVTFQAEVSLFDVLSGMSVAALLDKIACQSKIMPVGLN